MVNDWEYLCGGDDSVWFYVGGVEIFLVAGFFVNFLRKSYAYRFNQPFVECLVEAIQLVFGALGHLQQIWLDQPVQMEVASILVLHEIFCLSVLSCVSPQDDVDVRRKGALCLLIIVSTFEVLFLQLFIFAVCHFVRYVLMPICLLKSHCLGVVDVADASRLSPRLSVAGFPRHRVILPTFTSTRG